MTEKGVPLIGFGILLFGASPLGRIASEKFSRIDIALPEEVAYLPDEDWHHAGLYHSKHPSDSPTLAY